MSLKADADILNRILGCEQAAAAAYERFLAESAQYPQAWPLREIADEHRKAAARISQQIVQLGGQPDPGGGGAIWQGVRRTRELKVFDDRATLANLRDGERQEIEHCRWALRRESAYGPARTVLSDQVVPMLEKHVDILDDYLATAGRPTV